MSSIGHLLQNAKCHIETFGNSFFFSHVRREGNSITHNLTKHTLHVTSFLVWIEDIPPVLLYVIIQADLVLVP